MQENLKKKYGITDEELKRAFDQITYTNLDCSSRVLLALSDLFSNGDIAAEIADSDQNHLRAKHGISEEQWLDAFYKIDFNKCDPYVFIAIYELLVKGDIKGDGEAVTK